MVDTNHEEIVCCICGRTETSKWVRYKDKKGIWDEKSYICKSCYEYLKKYGTADKDKIEKNKKQYIKDKRNKIYCCICEGIETGKDFNGDPHWNRYRGNDGKGIWDRKSHICDGCYIRIYNRNPDNEQTSQLRKGFISKYSDKGQGIIVEMAITKARGAKNYNLELDNFNASFDIIDIEFNRLQVKGPALDKRGLWGINIGIEHNFDYLFIVCMDKNRENIKRVYIIPEPELFGETHVYIYEDYSMLYRGSKFEWIDKFRVSDIGDIKLYNDCYHSLMEYLNDMEYFSIEDIKKWMKI